MKEGLFLKDTCFQKDFKTHAYGKQSIHQCASLFACTRTDRETAARITEEIGNLMKEIETLVEEKNKDSSDLATIVSEGRNFLCNPWRIKCVYP